MGPLGVVRKAGPTRLIRDQDAATDAVPKPFIKASRGFYPTEPTVDAVQPVLSTKRPLAPTDDDAVHSVLFTQASLWLLPVMMLSIRVLSIKASAGSYRECCPSMLSTLLSLPGTLARNELDVRETPRGRFSRCFCSTRFTRNDP